MPSNHPAQTSSESWPGLQREYAEVVTPYEFEVGEPSGDGLTVVKLGGELDLTNAPEVDERLEGLGLEDALVLDLNDVGFVDSAALHMLFRVARRCGGQERLHVVLEPDAPIARTIEIVGLKAVATVRSSIDELVREPSS